MPFWQKLLITVIAMLVASFVADWIWYSILNLRLPSYIGGIIGGLTALPIWEFLRRFKAKPKP